MNNIGLIVQNSWYNSQDLYSSDPASLTTYPYWKIIPSWVLMWYRIAYTVLFSMFYRWVIIQSDYNDIGWHFQNTANLTALTAMWLITFSHFLDPTNLTYNRIANDFLFAAVPLQLMTSFGLKYLYDPFDNLGTYNYKFIQIYNLLIAIVLMVDILFDAIRFEYNEYSYLPNIYSVLIFIAQFGLFYFNDNPTPDQYLFTEIIIYGSLIGVQLFFGEVVNLFKVNLSYYFKGVSRYPTTKNDQMILDLIVQ